MSRLRARALLIALAGLIGSAGFAVAQSDVCRSYRAELAAMGRGGSSHFAALAQRQRGEIERMQAYRRSMSCSGFFQSWECRAAANRVQVMVSNYHSLVARAQTGGGERRAQLQAAVDHYCGAPVTEEERRPRKVSGARLVCVRACDGSFFPLANKPSGGEGPDEMCQALCPGTETAAYHLPGDSELERAVSTAGEPYTSLANAFRFTKNADKSCSCRKQGESWQAALQRAEEMIATRRGDILVTVAKAEELSRPKATPIKAVERAGMTKRQRAITAEAPAIEPPAETFTSLNLLRIAQDDEKEAAAQGAAAPTAGRESSGIGVQELGGAAVVSRGDGSSKLVTTDRGEKRTVRIIAPDIVAVPQLR